MLEERRRRWTLGRRGLPIAAVVLAAGAAVAVTGCGSAAKEAAQQRANSAAGSSNGGPVSITVGVAGGLNNAIYWDTMVAQSKGFFAKHGIDPKLLNTKDGPGTVQALASGSVPIGVGATDSMMNGIDQGAPISMVGSVSYADQALVVSKDIGSYGALKGKKIVSGAINAGSGLLLAYMLQRNGVDPRRDVKLVLSGNTAQRIAALTGGGAVATILNPPAIQQAIDSGFKVLQYSSDIVNYLFIAVGVNKGWAAKNGATVTKFMAALQDAHAWLRDPANEQQAEQILAKTLQTSQSAAKATYDNAIKDLHIFPASVAITPDIVNTAFKVLGERGKDPNKYINTNYVGASS